MMLLLLGASMSMFSSCEESDGEEESDEEIQEVWTAANTQWFADVADTARTAIASAKKQYGDDWENHCIWRMYKGILFNQGVQGTFTDSICVKIMNLGAITDVDHKGSPSYTDSVRVSYRGYLYPTDNHENVFGQSYYGKYDPNTAAPVLMGISGLVHGFSTAMEYMVEGDDWLIYIPQNMGYGSTVTGTIPAYSTLLYRVQLVKWYEAGSQIPSWY